MVTVLAALSLMSQSHIRPPAVPLITHDPYFSVWSFSDKLTDDWTKHWTGKNQALCGMVRVDGKTYRWMSRGLGDETSAAEQRDLAVSPSKTTYRFLAGGVELQVDFRSNQDIRRPDVCSKDETLIDMRVTSLTGAKHTVELYLDCSGELVVDSPSQEVQWSRLRALDAEAAAMWHAGKSPLNRTGDDHRCDWGTLYMVPEGGTIAFGGSEAVRKSFSRSGEVPMSDDFRTPRPVDDDWPVMGWASGKIQTDLTAVSRTVRLIFDDDFAIEYFRRPLRAAWRQGEAPFAIGAKESASDFDAYSTKLEKDWSLIGGEEFSALATLSYRQCLAAHKLVRDLDGSLLAFPKENFSNGCIATVDVIYPACPIFLAYNLELMKATLLPVMQYSAMPRWKWDFAPHDLGQYPKANGQVYGGGEMTEDNQMPVEESGNMLIMCCAYMERSGDKAFIERYWPQLTKWAQYLKKYGADPGNQLCTDDFAGHLAHNANLSVKAIVAMACYGKMCAAMGRSDEAVEWQASAHGFVTQWMKLADDGDHYRLAFDKPGSWSLKYNLVWDKVLKLGLFPREVYDKEIAWYLKHQNTFGVPLDSRADYTKLDWTVWIACMTSNKKDFDAVMKPVYKWMNETSDRIPLTDWYDTKTGKCIGFRARSVVGGVFMPLLLRQH